MDESPAWEPLQVQYADFTFGSGRSWVRRATRTRWSARQLGYWRDSLAGSARRDRLPTDRPRPAVHPSTAAGFHDPTDSVWAAGLARAHGVTVVHGGACGVRGVVGRLSGVSTLPSAPRLRVGASRPRRCDGHVRQHLGLADDVGPILVCRLAGQVRDIDLSAFANADVRSSESSTSSTRHDRTARHPLFQVVLSFENMEETTLELPGLSVSAGEFELDLSKFDLQLTLRRPA